LRSTVSGPKEYGLAVLVGLGFFQEIWVADLLWLDFLDPVSSLKVHQPISQTTEYLRIATMPFSSQILADQIDHGGEGAKAIVLLNMELQTVFVHIHSMSRTS
jgi:hypothetical protein